jgi:hypothetical protein
MQHLWDFSHVTLTADAAGKLRLEGRLDPVFSDDSRLSQAASLVTAMLPLARELHGSNRRLGLASEELAAVRPGTVEAALKNLIAYRNQLENRLAMRFMEACSREARTLPSDCRVPLAAASLRVALMDTALQNALLCATQRCYGCCCSSAPCLLDAFAHPWRHCWHT